MESKPNILVFITEDLSPHASVYGDPLSPLKSVDAVAKDSLLFENAFCVSPVCAPSRFSMITGMEPATCGPAHQMRADGVLPDDFPTITTSLREAGYYCMNVGKADYNFTANMKKIWDVHSMDADWSNRNEGQPFFAVFNLVETHESSIFDQSISIVEPSEVSVPPYLPDVPEIREDIAKYYSAMNASEKHMSRILKRLADENLSDETVILIFSDHGGCEPRSKRFVYDSGSRVPLIIKIPEAMRDSVIWRSPARIKTAVSLIDFAPTICDIAGVTKPITMTGSSLLDSLQDDTNRIVFNGRDRMDENYEFIRTARTSKYLYIRNYMPNRPWLQYQAYAWQAPGYQAWEREYRAGKTNEVQSRYFGPKPAEEFYDTETDKHQINNLIDTPELQAIISTFRSALDMRTVEIFDNGFIPEGTQVEGIINSRNKELYPIAEVLDLAKLAIQRDVKNLDVFVEKISHPNEIIRFWAAQGMLYLGDQAKPAISVVSEHLNDASDHVRIAMAELGIILGLTESSIDTYRSLMSETKPFQVIMRATKAIVSSSRPLTELTEQVSQLMAKLREPEFEAPGYFNAYMGVRYLDSVLTGEYNPSSKIFDLELFLERLRKSSPDMVASMSKSK